MKIRGFKLFLLRNFNFSAISNSNIYVKNGEKIYGEVKVFVGMTRNSWHTAAEWEKSAQSYSESFSTPFEHTVIE